jgi:hypothetical protein
MKSLFEDGENLTRLELGVEENNYLTFKVKNINMEYVIICLSIQEALVFQQETNKYLEQIKAKHRSQIPWYKSLGL